LCCINYMLVFHLFAFRFRGTWSRRSFRPLTHLSVGRQRPSDFRRAHPLFSCLYYTGPFARVRASFPSRRRVCTSSSCPTMGYRRCAPSLRLPSFSACDASIIPVMIMFPSSLRVCPSRVPVRQHHRRRLGASRAYRATPRDLSVNTFDLLPFVAPRPGGHEMTPRQRRGAGAPHVPGGS
jgi:hypothetical protein